MSEDNSNANSNTPASKPHRDNLRELGLRLANFIIMRHPLGPSDEFKFVHDDVMNANFKIYRFNGTIHVKLSKKRPDQKGQRSQQPRPPKGPREQKPKAEAPKADEK